jgi:hypothetical protein
VSAPTCAGTDKLTWNGSAFLCASDVSGGSVHTSGAVQTDARNGTQTIPHGLPGAPTYVRIHSANLGTSVGTYTGAATACLYHQTVAVIEAQNCTGSIVYNKDGGGNPAAAAITTDGTNIYLRWSGAWAQQGVLLWEASR